MSQPFLPGQKVAHALNPEWGVGEVLTLEEDGRTGLVAFPFLEEEIRLTLASEDLRRFFIAPGTLVEVLLDDSEGEVVAALREEGGLWWYGLADGREVREDDLIPDVLPETWLDRLIQKDEDDLYDFENRRRGLALDCSRRVSGAGAVMGARVMLFPHQLHVVRRIHDRDRIRLLLADEVGLGKTIQACLIFAALHAEGRAGRTLILTPSPLVVQWLGELWRKFHRVFVMVDEERLSDVAIEHPDQNPFQVHSHAVCSLEWLAGEEEALQAALAEDSRWDLVIVDEAHHLRRGREPGQSNREWRAVSQLANHTRSLLLLTATPMQLDPYEHFSLLHLLDSDVFPDWNRFSEQLSQVGAANRLVQEMDLGVGQGDGGILKKVGRELATGFSAHPSLVRLGKTLGPGGKGAAEIQKILKEIHPFGDRVISSRRQDVGGFPERVPCWERVSLPKERRLLEARVRAILSKEVERAGPLQKAEALERGGEWMRRAASHPMALLAAVEEARGGAEDPTWRRALNELKEQIQDLRGTDPKTRWAVEVVRGCRAASPPRKVLIFTEFVETMHHLKARLQSEAQVRVAVFHAGMGQKERDLEVARFRAQEGGVPVMICTEAGAEGRNFQFVSDLIHFDLPFSPTRLEQRIGRLDRIGQKESQIRIHVCDPKGGIEEGVSRVMAATEVFQRPVGGLDPVLEAVSVDIGRLVLSEEATSESAWDRLIADLIKRLGEARSDLQRGVDHLLHKAAFDPARYQALLEAYPRDFEEDLAEWLVEAAEQLDLILEEREGRACWYVELGGQMRVESLPGLMHGQRWLGTFDREEALEKEEIDFFATGHPLVEGLFGLIHDGPYGRVAMRRFREPNREAAMGLEMEFLLEPPEGRWSSLGSVLSPEVFLVVVDSHGRVRDDLVPLLTAQPSRAHPLDPDELPAGESFESLVRATAAVGEKAAESWARAKVEAARKALKAQAEEELTGARETLQFLLHRAESGPAREALMRDYQEREARFQAGDAVLAGARPILHAVGWWEIIPARPRMGTLRGRG